MRPPALFRGEAMPVVHEYVDGSGLYIKSRINGMMSTFQVSSQGRRWLRGFGADHDGAQIAVDDLIYMIDRRWAYTGGSGPGEAPDDPPVTRPLALIQRQRITPPDEDDDELPDPIPPRPPEPLRERKTDETIRLGDTCWYCLQRVLSDTHAARAVLRRKEPGGYAHTVTVIVPRCEICSNAHAGERTRPKPPPSGCGGCLMTFALIVGPLVGAWVACELAAESLQWWVPVTGAIAGVASLAVVFGILLALIDGMRSPPKYGRRALGSEKYHPTIEKLLARGYVESND
jgi:hypothetical protein